MTRTIPAAFRVQRYLGGLSYPADKSEILARARAKGADEQALRALEGLPERSYDSPIALACEVGRAGDGG